MTVPHAIDALGLPPPWRSSEPLLPRIRACVEAPGRCLVVLDDDPLGGQSLHGVPVLTTWDAEALELEMARSPVFLLLTNTRALDPAAAASRAREVGAALRSAADRAGRVLEVACRSDSTLRGHFFTELRPLTETLGSPGAAVPDAVYVLVPYFGAGGRYTIGDTQYVLADGALIPVADTEFARDAAFGFDQSHLPSWVEAKTAGSVAAGDVATVSLDELRLGGPDIVAAKLRRLPAVAVAIANAVTDGDVEVFVAGLLQAEAYGQRFICSGASPFVRMRAGVPAKPLLDASETWSASGAGGFVVAGSYVARTSEQLEVALALPGVRGVELRVDALIGVADGASEVGRVIGEVSPSLQAGTDVVLYTSRSHRAGAGASETRAIAEAVSSGLCAVLDGLDVRPRFVIAKGGSTASDLAVRSLGVRRAWVLGQLLAGVPVWELGPESKYPGMKYVIFAGNVGDSGSLAEAMQLMHRS